MTVESWLNECMAATRSDDGCASPTISGDTEMLNRNSFEIAHSLDQQQTEQLLASCTLNNDVLLTSIFNLFEEKNR